MAISQWVETTRVYHRAHALPSRPAYTSRKDFQGLNPQHRHPTTPVLPCFGLADYFASPSHVPSMSDESDSPNEAPNKKRARSARAFTSLLLGIFGILLGGGAYLLHHWHTTPPAFMQLGQADAQTATNDAPTQNATNAMQDLIRQETAAPFQMEIARKLLGFSTAIAVLAGIIGTAGLITGVLSLRLDDTEHGKAWVGMLFSVVAILAWGLAGWNTVLQVRIMKKVSVQIGDGFGNYTDAINNAMNMADDLLPGVRAGQDTVNYENEWLGKQAPDLRVQPVNSRGEVLLSEERNVHPVLLVVLNTQSAPCQPMIDVLNELDRDIPSSDLLILVISHREKPDALRAAVKAKKIRFLLGKADSPVEPYKDALSPTVFAIDHTGVIRKALVGSDAGKTDSLRNIARELVNSARRK
ncbi:MAG: hypothetical protein VX705_11005 [Verrucomicrobiota bacterium]|nr:hypothetical protein [Verrucomicrobiota bacterium]